MKISFQMLQLHSRIVFKYKMSNKYFLLQAVYQSKSPQTSEVTNTLQRSELSHSYIYFKVKKGINMDKDFIDLVEWNTNSL